MLPVDIYKNAPMKCDVDFHYTNPDLISDEILCLVCATPWIQPLELAPCNHILCYACCKKLLDKKFDSCPKCRNVITGFNEPNKALSSIVDALQVRCYKCGNVAPRNHHVTHECTRRSIYAVAADWADKLAKEGKHDLAITELTRAVDVFEALLRKDRKKVAKEAAQVFLRKARSLLVLRQWEKCVEAATLCISNDDTLGEAYYLRGAALRFLRDGSMPNEVIDDLQAALERDSTLTEARKALLELGVAKVAPSDVQDPPSSLRAASSASSAHVDPYVAPSTPASVPPPSAASSSAPEPVVPASDDHSRRPEHVIKNGLTLLQQYHGRHGDAFFDFFRSESRKGREAFLRAIEPYMVDRAGKTMDVSGEDLTEVVYLVPEVNINGLCGTDSGLHALTQAVTGQQFEAIVMEAVKEVHEALKVQGPRRDYLALQDDCKERLVVEAKTGKVCNTKIEAKTEREFNEMAAEMMRRKESLEWVPLFLRLLALDRIALIVELLLKCFIKFMGEKNLPIPIPFRNIFGCLQCGKKGDAASKKQQQQQLVACETCKQAFYCSEKCKAHHDANGHKNSCQIHCPDLHNTLREALKKSIPTDTEDVTDPNFRFLKEMCDERINRADPFGNGDQSPVPLDSNPQGKMQRLRTVWASGADFSPRSPGSRTTPFFNACYVANIAYLQRIITEVNGKSAREKYELLNRRETLMRFTPLLCCIAGARGKDMLGGGDFVAAAKLLIDNGSDVNAKDMCGFSCVHHCSTAYASSHSLQILPLLIAKGANPNERNRFDETPILEPVLANKTDVVRALLQVGADPNMKACGGMVSAMSLSMVNPQMTALLLSAAPNTAIKVGERVTLRNLVNKPHLNGKAAKVVEIEVGKYLLELEETGDRIMCKYEHVTRAEAESPSGGGCGACGKVVKDMKRCSRCKATQYCSEACQKANWPMHKATCKPLTAILISKPSAASSSKYSFDLTTGRTQCGAKTPKANGATGEFIVKVQVPMDMATREPHRNGVIMMYDERHTLDWTVTRGEQSSAFDSLYDLVTKDGFMRLKAYLTASMTPSGELAIVPKVLPVQPW